MTERPYNGCWQALLSNASGDMRHNLWISAIRTIALAKMEEEKVEPDDEWLDACDGYSGALEGMADERIEEWLDDSMPIDSTLVNWLGEYDLFREWGLSWFEKICFEGNACGCPDDIAWSAHLRIGEHIASLDEITNEVVEDFFVQWRDRFLRRVINEATKAK